MHLIIDGYSNNSAVLSDKEYLHDWLDGYPATIGMTKISPTFVTEYTGPNPKDWGISGFVVIAESHISFHTFVERDYVNVDVFSCKDFDADKVISDIQNTFQLVESWPRLIDREWTANPTVRN
ncbi:MAG: S-adenosylmethionine decarboxylase [Dehalococcoidia bacterium]|nr:S-adenosylmethionine decarboxylase [Dehalococcoidia bacterium]